MSGGGRAAAPGCAGDDFAATKLVLVCGADLLVYLRDDFAHIPWPAHWDLPGGTREGREAAPDCALRELHEEFGLRLSPDRLRARHVFANPTAPGAVSVFYTGRLTTAEIAAIRFGDEGQYWRMMPAAEYVAHPRAVPHFRAHVAHCLDLPCPAGADLHDQGGAEAPP